MTEESIQELALLRKSGLKRSSRVCELGESILSSGNFESLKSEKWNFLEQLAVAALDCAKLDLAKVCIERLNTRFPDSPRVKPLVGMMLEAKGKPEVAKGFYEQELVLDETNSLLRKRLIALHLHVTAPTLSRQLGIQLLVNHLDTVYTDTEAWLELAHAYLDENLLAQALSAFSDLILLQPQNPAFSFRYAQLAEQLGDLDLAYRYYLRTLELLGGDGIAKSTLARQAAIALKQLIPKLRGKGLPGSTAPSPLSASSTPSPQRLDDMDAILTEHLAQIYGSSTNGKSSSDSIDQLVQSWTQKLDQELAAH